MNPRIIFIGVLVVVAVGLWFGLVIKESAEYEPVPVTTLQEEIVFMNDQVGVLLY